MNSYEIPITDKKNPPVVKFPGRCVNCGKPKETVLPLKLHMGVQKRDQMVMMDLPVPVCKECEKKEQKIAGVTLIPFMIAGLITFVIVFIPVWLITPDGTTTQTIGLSITVAAFAGMIAGLIGGTLVEFLLRLMFVPVYGRLLLKRPLTVFGLFDDSEDVLGLSARFASGKKSLMLTFENDDVAREFASLNHH
jgi:hypothetical protein